MPALPTSERSAYFHGSTTLHVDSDTKTMRTWVSIDYSVCSLHNHGPAQLPCLPRDSKGAFDGYGREPEKEFQQVGICDPTEHKEAFYVQRAANLL